MVKEIQGPSYVLIIEQWKKEKASKRAPYIFSLNKSTSSKWKWEWNERASKQEIDSWEFLSIFQSFSWRDTRIKRRMDAQILCKTEGASLSLTHTHHLIFLSFHFPNVREKEKRRSTRSIVCGCQSPHFQHHHLFASSRSPQRRWFGDIWDRVSQCHRLHTHTTNEQCQSLHFLSISP